MIIVDNREFRGKLVKELFKKGIDICAKQLSVGDYIIGDLVVERKDINDFYSSIIDKRIFSQLRSLKKFEKKLIIVEGEISSRNIHPNAIKGLIASIMVDYGIPIAFLKDSAESADFLSIIDKRMEKSIELIPDSKSIKNDYDAAINFLCSIPGIGAKTAKSLILNFKSLKNIFLADEKSIREALNDSSCKKFMDFLEKKH
ncbi:MAG: ERCC4 domain-containing protein [Candidatus Omnitrophica bacterium]|nr:ERCC4 domain-containing protein [Candidatus Omnitrophota bacterium]